jgi:hypothetical protein
LLRGVLRLCIGVCTKSRELHAWRLPAIGPHDAADWWWGISWCGESDGDGAQTSLSSSSINNIFDSAPIVLLLLALEARSFSQAQKGRRMF